MVAKWIKRIAIGAGLLVITILLGLVLFLGPLTKWGIQRYDEEWTGRTITVRKAAANVFTGEISLYDLTLFEPSKTDTFFYAKQAYANLEYTHFFRDDYDVLEIFLLRPYVSIVQNGSQFNFDDLLGRFVIEDSIPHDDDEAQEFRYRLDNIHLDSGTVMYRSEDYRAEFQFKDIMARTPSIVYDNPQHHYEVSTRLASGGSVSGTIDISIDSLDYLLRVMVDSVNISPFTPYALDAIDIEALRGNLTLEFVMAGDFDVPEAIALRGSHLMRDFQLVTQSDTLLATGSFNFSIDSLNTAKGIYDWGLVQMDRPYIKFELYPDGDNFTRLLKDTTTATVDSDTVLTAEEYGNPFLLLTAYATRLLNDYVMQDYSIDSVSVSNGTVIYNDFSLEEPFAMRMDSLFLSSGALNSKDSDLNFASIARINRTGFLEGHLSFDPHNLENMDMVYQVRDVRISSFSPYSTYYVAHPFNDGLIYYDNKTQIFNHVIASENKLVIRKIQVGKKIKNETALDLPLRLAVAILRDKDGDVTLDVPVEGNLDDPNYRFGKVIWSVIKNLLVKAATSPFKLLARAIDANEDDLKAIRFEYLSDSLTRKQQRNLSLLARVIKQKPELKIDLTYLKGYPDELEMLAAFEAKKRYVLKIDTTRDDQPTPEQLQEIEKLSINDSAFVRFLDRHLLFEGSVPSIEKCKRYVGRRRLSNKMEAIISRRKQLVQDYLITEQQLPVDAFEIVDAEDRISDGIPQFEVSFNVAEP